MGGDKDDRDGASLGRQIILKLEAIHPGQVDVQDETRSIVDTLGSQEFLRRPVSVRTESNRSHKALQRPAYRRIVIHDRNVAGRALLCYCSPRVTIADLHLVSIVNGRPAGDHPALVAGAILL